MEAGSNVALFAEAGPLGKIPFTARVLFWWEVQSFRESSVVVADIVTKRFFDRSKFMRLMVDAMLVSIRIDGREMSCEDTKGRRWSQCLHPSVIKPIYDAYVGACHPSANDLLDFREKVTTYFGEGEDGDYGIFVAPPELFEVLFLQKCGGLTLTEIRSMSYAKFRKYLVVMENIGGSVGPAPTPAVSASIQNPGLSPDIPGIPLSVLQNPNISPAEAKRQTMDIAASMSRQGQFGRPPE